MIRDFTETTLTELKDIVSGAIDEYLSGVEGGTYHGMLAHTITVAEEDCVVNLADIESEAESEYDYWMYKQELIDDCTERLENIFVAAREKDSEIADTVEDRVSTISDPFIESLEQLVNSINVSSLGNTESEFDFNRGYYHSNFSNSIFGDPDSFSEKMDDIKGGISTQLYDYLSTYKDDKDAENELKELINKPIGELSYWEIDALAKLMSENDLSEYRETNSLTLEEQQDSETGKVYLLGKTLSEVVQDLDGMSDEEKVELLVKLESACREKNINLVWDVFKTKVPEYASDTTVLDVYDFITYSTETDHYNSNKANWEKNKNIATVEIDDKTYIEKQDNMSFLEYGVRNADYNVCEVAAYTNAMVKKGKCTVDDLPEIISLFETEGTALGGIAGTDPNKIKSVLEKTGSGADLYTSEEYYENSDKIERRYDTYIITVYNDETDISEGIHTMCITKEDDGQFILHNDSSNGGKNDFDNNQGYTYVSSLDDAINVYNKGKSKLITIIGVD